MGMEIAKKKKVMKPPRLFYKNGDYWRNKAWVMDDAEYPIMIDNSVMTLKHAKQIHTWLSRAIEYLEREGK